MSIAHDDVNWFENIFGFRESVENVQNFLECQQNENGAILISRKNQQRFPAGKFSLYNISSFRHLTARNGGYLHIKFDV